MLCESIWCISETYQIPAIQFALSTRQIETNLWDMGSCMYRYSTRSVKIWSYGILNHSKEVFPSWTSFVVLLPGTDHMPTRYMVPPIFAHNMLWSSNEPLFSSNSSYSKILTSSCLYVTCCNKKYVYTRLLWTCSRDVIYSCTIMHYASSKCEGSWKACISLYSTTFPHTEGILYRAAGPLEMVVMRVK